MRARPARASALPPCAAALASVALAIAAPSAASGAEPVDDALRLAAELDAAEAATHLRSDPAATERLWSDEFVVTNPFGTVLTKAQVLGRVKKGQITFARYARTMEQARRVGPLLLSIGREELEGAPGSVFPPGKAVRLRYTHVWREENGVWRLYLRHASVPSPDPGDR